MLKKILVAVCAVMLAGVAYAGNKIDLNQASGGITAQGGVGDSAKVILSAEDQTNTVVRTENQFEYETVAASQTNQMMGGTGAVGDLIHGVLCVTTAASAAVVTLKDGSLTAFNIGHIFAGAGTFWMPLDLVSVSGGWQITTSTNTTCVGIGRFS